jgi:plastocyanin
MLLFTESAFDRSPRLNGRGYATNVAAPIKARTICLHALLMLLAALPAALRADATIEGSVPLPKARSAPVMNRRYEIVAKGGVLSTNPPLGVVYLEGAFPRPAAAPVAQMAQRDLTFVPTLLPVQVGTKVEFPNFDETYHNIFSYSPAKRFDLGRYRPDEKPVPAQLFDVAGLVTLHCDIHEHMRALILVLDTPHFVVTEPDGRFRLTRLPAGRYTLKVWIDSKTTLERPVELGTDATLRVDFP